jgi:aminoglycoside phosphotransferase
MPGRPTQPGLPNRPPEGIDLSGRVAIYRHSDRVVYNVRNRYILKRTSYSSHNSEAATHEYIGRNSTVPVPYVYAEWLSSDRRYHFLLEARVPGYTLADCWRELSLNAKLNIAQQVVRYMVQLSDLASSTQMETVSGKRLPNNCFNPRPQDPRGTLRGRWTTDDEIFENEFYPSLRRAGLRRETISMIKRTMPRANGRFVLTHCDLYVGNVMVDPARGVVTGIIDWESGGFWPEWFQYARITHGCSDDDGEWKYMLSRLCRHFIQDAEHGRVWYDMVGSFVYDPNSAQARAWLRLLVRYLQGQASVDDLDNYQSVGVEGTENQPQQSWRSRAPSGMLNNRGGRGVEGYYSTAFGRR